jgi:acetyl-CoA carboxylase biotin carboxyl carrier protein
MDTRLIQRLVRIMQKGELSDLEVEDTKEGLRLRLRRGGEPVQGAAPVVHVTHAGGPAPALPAAAPAAAAAPEAEAPAQGTPFPSPMVGTYYRSPSPEAEPFVDVGDTVGPESVLCIIEAMKVLNEFKAVTSGTIVEVLVENGEPVEFGQPLFLLR